MADVDLDDAPQQDRPARDFLAEFRALERDAAGRACG
jgi:hypothetical protein